MLGLGCRGSVRPCWCRTRDGSCEGYPFLARRATGKAPNRSPNRSQVERTPSSSAAFPMVNLRVFSSTHTRYSYKLRCRRQPFLKRVVSVCDLLQEVATQVEATRNLLGISPSSVISRDG